MINKGDVLYLDSDNGMRYTIEVLSVNDYREPNMKYAVDMIDGNGARLEIMLL